MSYLLQVQLSTMHTPTISFPPNTSLPPTTTASKLLASIEAQESDYQTSLTEAYHEMGEKTFKGLRRALPLTRQKLDWDKVRGHAVASPAMMCLTGCYAALPVSVLEIRSWDTNSGQSWPRAKAGSRLVRECRMIIELCLNCSCSLRECQIL